jgi:hypothetical protein
MLPKFKIDLKNFENKERDAKETTRGRGINDRICGR